LSSMLENILGGTTMNNEQLADKVCEQIKEDLLSTDAPLHEMLRLIANTDAKKFLINYLPKKGMIND